MRSRRPDDPQALLSKWRKRFWLVTAIVVFLAGDAAWFELFVAHAPRLLAVGCQEVGEA